MAKKTTSPLKAGSSKGKKNAIPQNPDRTLDETSHSDLEADDAIDARDASERTMKALIAQGK